MTHWFEGVRAVVVGFGETGVAAAKVLALHGASVLMVAGWDVPRGSWEVAFADAAIELASGPYEQAHVHEADLVIASPNVPERTPPIRWARQRGVTVWSELELAAHVCEVPFVAITGTNGKSTTTRIVAEAMRLSGLDAVACGDARHPFSLAATEGHEALAVEVASSQLHYVSTLRPAVSVLLNLAPDHLDWHGTFEAYAAAKARVFLRQGGNGIHVGALDDRLAAQVSKRARCRIRWFGGGDPAPGDVGIVDGSVVSRIGRTRRSLGRPASFGPGGPLDAAAAAAASISFGVAEDAVAQALSQTRALPHRGEAVGAVRGVRFVDNSKATNPHAACASVEEVGRCVLIAGGDTKGVDMGAMASVADRLDGVVAIGQASDEIAELFQGAVPFERATTMVDAVERGWRLAPVGGTVLLAPACASLDMFRDYAERGEAFSTAVGLLGRSLGP